jgi:hypothetical protein
VWLERWLPPTCKYDRETAIAELAMRYFASRGPAAAQDFAWWTGMKLSDAKAGIALNSRALASVDIDGVTHWMAEPSVVPKKAGLQLLPGFDELLLAYTDRTASLAAENAGKIVPGNNGQFRPTITREGRVIGTWKRELKRKSVIIKPSFFTDVNEATRRAFGAAAAQYAGYLGVDLSPDGFAFLHPGTKQKK